MPELTTFPTDALGRMLVPATSIDVSNRLRKVFSEIEELAEDIKLNGLIQPIVITRELKLVAGGRRFKAMTEVLGWTELPCVYKDAENDTHHKIMEIMENVARESFTWQERVLGIVEVHEISQREALKDREKWTREQTASLFKVSRATVNNAVWLAECIRAGDKEIIEAAGVREALDILIKRAEDAATKRLALVHVNKNPAPLKAKVTKVSPGKTTVIPDDLGEDEGFVRAAPSARKDFSQLNIQVSNDEDPETGEPAAEEHVIPLSRLFVNSDGVDYGNSLPPNYVDHIITDIPYGIDMDNLDRIKNIDAVRAEHDVEQNIALYHRMFPMFSHVLKDKGFVVMWYDLDHHNLLQDLAVKFGFSVQRWPLVWCKTHQCKNDAPGQNFTKNTEVAMVLRKGNATLLEPQLTSYFYCSGEKLARQLGHPFAKPVELWRWVYKACCLVGQSVFDPFVGVGSSAIAAIEHGLRPLGCELREEHYHKLIVNVADQYKRVIGNVRFE